MGAPWLIPLLFLFTVGDWSEAASMPHGAPIQLCMLTEKTFQVPVCRSFRHKNSPLYQMLTAWNTFSHHVEPTTASPARRFIVDTDAGSDDAVGLLHMLGAQKLGWGVQVDAITTVNGNTHVDNVVRNVLLTLDTAQRLDVLVFKGQNKSILVTPKSDNYFGKDGFGDVQHKLKPPNEDRYLQKDHAVFGLVNLVKDNPGVFNLLAMGPLTNVALALRIYPQLLEDLQEVYILGGAVEGRGNVAPGVEFNFHIDPEAAQIVLTEAARVGKVLNLLPHETFAIAATFDMEWRLNVLGAMPSPEVQLLNKVEAAQLHGTRWKPADGLMAAVAVHPAIAADHEEVHLEVETCGAILRGAGATYWARLGANRTVNARIVRGVHIDNLKLQFLQTLNPRNIC